jgi:Flp pilus assembly protein TadG
MKNKLISRRRRGNALIEFALLWSVLFPVVAGTAQFGSAFYQYNNLCSTVRNAARYASIQTYQSANATVPTALQTAVRNMVRYETPTPADGAAPLYDIPAANILVQMNFANNVPDSVTVSITQFNIDAVLKTFTINNKPTTSFVYTGRWAPLP